MVSYILLALLTTFCKKLMIRSIMRLQLMLHLRIYMYQWDDSQ